VVASDCLLERTATRLRWGVLGAAKIATAKVIPGMRGCERAVVAAIASRDAAKADLAAAALDIPNAYGSYEKLIADPDIDVVYIPLPNHLHVEWATRAAEAGKHVLCEKPIGLSADDARTLIAVRDRTGVSIQEAFMYRSHPQWRRAVSIVRSGRLGEIRAIVGAFSYFNDDRANIRNIAAVGGGGLYDIGCYLINTARLIFDGEPRQVRGSIARDPESGVDRLTSMLLEFDHGHAIGTCGTQQVPYQRVQILGTRARLEIEIPFNIPPDQTTRLFLDDGSDLAGKSTETIEIPAADQYAVQADEFSAAILARAPAPYPLEDSLANMVVIDRVRSASV
jgi:predicted dehydrogenase